jgi:outer membrane protein assembly factor BamD (BamD/ComL family)
MKDKLICPSCGHEYGVSDGYVKLHGWITAPKYLSAMTRKVQCTQAPCHAFIEVPERFREAAIEREASMREG